MTEDEQHPRVAHRPRHGRHGRSWWDRGAFLAALAVTLLLGAVGTVAAVTLVAGHDGMATVRACSTEYHFNRFGGRHQTRCDISVDGLGRRAVDTAATHAAGDRVRVVTLAGYVSDPALLQTELWLLLPTAALAGFLRWKKWPARSSARRRAGRRS
jgi:hypothetical protein